MFIRTCLVLLALSAALLAPADSRAAIQYTVNVLPDGFHPADINNTGGMAGALYAQDGSVHAAVYADGVVTDLGTFGGTYSFANGINDAGTVAGNFGTATGAGHAFVYQNGGMRDLGAAYALALNAGGDIVGQRYLDDGATGFLYRAGTITEIPCLGTGTISLAAAINDHGQIVGESNMSDDPYGATHPYLYDAGTLADLGTLAGRGVSSAVAINNAGQVAGYSTSTSGRTHVFVYERGVMTDLGGFGGLDVTVGGMNGQGQVVGTGNTWDGPDIPFISRAGALIDLNTLIDPASGWALTSALDINDSGQIIADACRRGVCSAVRLDLASAVPEPDAAWLLAPGLLLLGACRHARRREPFAAARTVKSSTAHPSHFFNATPGLAMFLLRYIAVLILSFAAAVSAPVHAAPLYKAAFLPLNDFSPVAINNTGQIAGSVHLADGSSRVVLYSGGALQDLGLPAGAFSYASAINDAGAITGRTMVNDEAHGFLYQNGALTDLGANTSGWGINARGDVVGASYTEEGTFGFVYSAGTFMQLPNLGTGRLGVAVDINNHGDIAGFSYTNYDESPPPLHPYLYRDKTLLDLGPLGDSIDTTAVAINNAGHIAGEGKIGNDDHVFLYADGVIRDLGFFGGSNLGVVGFNDRGTLIGNASTGAGGFLAFTNIGDVLVDLNTLLDPVLGWEVSYVYANNDLGQIVGYGCQGDTCGLVQLDLVDAVPEPGATWLLAAGLLIVAGAMRRKPGRLPTVPA
jgi:probable HAF family extracellular repeat protein